MEELGVLGAEGLAADRLHGAAEAVQERESRHVPEGESEGGAGQRQLAQTAEEGGGDGGFCEPREVHRHQGDCDPPLRFQL